MLVRFALQRQQPARPSLASKLRQLHRLTQVSLYRCQLGFSLLGSEYLHA